MAPTAVQILRPQPVLRAACWVCAARRLWRDLGSGRVEQSNLYQAPAKLAGSGCTRFAPYLRADATRPGSIRPDGYGLRSW
jgi:hypothetical protein